MWCRRRRSRRRRPPGLERVPAMWWCRARHLASLRRPPLVKMRRRNKDALPLHRGERKRRRSPQQGRPRGRGKGRSLRRTTPPTPKREERSGRTEPSVRRHRKYSHTRMTHSIFKCAAYPNVECYLRSPPRAALDDSSSGSLDSSDMNSVPPTVSPSGAYDAEAASRRTGQEEVVLEELQGNLQDPRSKGDETPQGSQSGFVPDTAPDSTILARAGRTPFKRSKPSEPATSVQPKAPDSLLEALEGATIDEEHHTVMSAVVQRVQSAKSGLNEACASLLTGFQVSKKYAKFITA